MLSSWMLLYAIYYSIALFRWCVCVCECVMSQSCGFEFVCKAVVQWSALRKSMRFNRDRLIWVAGGSRLLVLQTESLVLMLFHSLLSWRIVGSSLYCINTNYTNHLHGASTTKRLLHTKTCLISRCTKHTHYVECIM